MRLGRLRCEHDLLRRSARRGRARSDRPLLAGGQLPLRGSDLSARQSALARAAAARAHQAAAARSLGHDAGTQFHLRPCQPADPGTRRQRDLRHRPRSRRPGSRGEHLPRGNLQRGLSPHRARQRGAQAALPSVLLPRRDPQSCRAPDARLDPRGGRARLRDRPCVRRRLRQPRPAGVLRDRRR